MRPKKLTDNEVADLLTRIPKWERQGDELTRLFTFSNFVGSMQFVNRLGEASERLQHHPDIDIRYSKVIIALTTHDAGGITSLDFELAQLADGFVSD